MEVLKKRQRFTDHDDLALLREVLGQNPYENSSLWEVIQENHTSITGKQFSIRTLKDHLERLIKIWLEQFKILKAKSGIEIVKTEKDQLCQNIYEMMQEFSAKKKTRCTENKKKLKGIEARNLFAEKLTSLINTTDREMVEVNPIPYDCENVVPAPLQNLQFNFINESEGCSSVNTDTCEQINGNLDLTNEGADPDEPGPSFQCSNMNAEINIPQQFPRVMSGAGVQSTPKPFTVLGPVRSRKRKINTQRQGLAYLEQYDAKQVEIKKKEQELVERKLVIEERKITLMEKQFNLVEYEVKKNYELLEKKLNGEEKKICQLIEKQGLLLNLLINKLS